MNLKELEKFTREVLNESGLRSKLREKIPHIDRLEGLDSLRDLSLKTIITVPLFKVWYEGIASQKLYPHVMANLIKRRVINRNNALDSSVENKGQQDEYEQVRFQVSENAIRVTINAYNPDYQG